MTLKSTPDCYGNVAVAVHWLTAILILALIGTGLRSAGADPETKLTLLRLHVPMAIVVLLLTLGRIVWWWRLDRKPTPVAGMPNWQERIAATSHVLFYVLILGMVGSGLGIMALSGALPIIFGGGSLPDFNQYLPRITHGIGAKLFIGLLVLHVGAALYHQFGRRDGLLGRMWFHT